MALDMRFGMRWRHAKLRSRADAYLDGELPAARAAEFESHVAVCGSCSGTVTAGRELKAALGALPLVEAPRSFTLTALMAGQARPAPARRPAEMLRVAQMTTGVAIVALAAVVAVDLRGGTSTSDERAMMATGAVENSAGGAMGPGGPAAQGREQGTGGSAPVQDSSSAPTLPHSVAGGQATAAPPQAPEAAGSKSAVPGAAYSARPDDTAGGAGEALDSGAESADEGGGHAARFAEVGLLGVIAIAASAWLFLTKRSRRSLP